MLTFTAMRFSVPPRGRPGAPSSSFQGMPFGDEAEKGRRMTATFDLGCWLRSTSEGVRDAFKHEAVSAPDWQLTGAGHGVLFVAALNAAKQAWRCVELF